MEEVNVRISIYSQGDISSLTTAINQVKIEGYNYDIVYPKKLTINQDEIIIFQQDSLDTPVMKEFLSNAQKINNKVIFVVKEENAFFISSLLKAGYSDFFVFPFEYFNFINFLQDIIADNSYKTGGDEVEYNPDAQSELIIGSSKEIQKILELSRKVADSSNINILITGETGTGKGLLARTIHNLSTFRSAPFVDITCTAIPESLLESELFGYEAGAFTNAKNQKQGLFELAEDGTLFLDEIGDLSLSIQSKLLRTIEKKVIRRLGGVTDIFIHARIISATNSNLEKKIEAATFRKDLFHRLNTISIELPPLRERGNDILLLANFFINRFNNTYNKFIRKIDPALKDFMLRYPWPGNIRELRNSIERGVLLSDDTTLKVKNFTVIKSTPELLEKTPLMHPSFININTDYEKTSLKEIEKLYAKETLNRLQGNKSQTAKVLGISRPKLDQLLK